MWFDGRYKESQSSLPTLSWSTAAAAHEATESHLNSNIQASVAGEPGMMRLCMCVYVLLSTEKIMGYLP